MPKMNGLEFLKIIKADDQFKTLPVIVFTTSIQEPDIIESFELSVAGYMVKPADYEQFLESMRTVNSYWNLNKLPENVQG